MHTVTHSLQQLYGEGRTPSSSVEALRGSANIQGQETKGRVTLNPGLWFHRSALSGWQWWRGGCWARVHSFIQQASVPLTAGSWGRASGRGRQAPASMEPAV